MKKAAAGVLDTEKANIQKDNHCFFVHKHVTKQLPKKSYLHGHISYTRPHFMAVFFFKHLCCRLYSSVYSINLHRGLLLHISILLCLHCNVSWLHFYWFYAIPILHAESLRVTYTKAKQFRRAFWCPGKYSNTPQLTDVCMRNNWWVFIDKT